MFRLQIPFTNVAISIPEFQKIKSELPCGQVPTLEIENGKGDNIILAESNAILRFVAKLGGIHPTNFLAAAEVDMVVDMVDDLQKFLTLTVTGPKAYFIGDEDWSEEKIIEIRKKLMEPGVSNNIAYVSTSFYSFPLILSHYFIWIIFLICQSIILPCPVCVISLVSL